MPVKHIISPGIGFSPGTVKYIVTRGFISQISGVLLVSERTLLFADNQIDVNFPENEDQILYPDNKIDVKFPEDKDRIFFPDDKVTRWY